jgi:hypothetical protein
VTERWPLFLAVGSRRASPNVLRVRTGRRGALLIGGLSHAQELTSCLAGRGRKFAAARL